MKPELKEVAAEFADRSADVLMADGWTQNKLVDRKTGARCYLGAQHKVKRELSSYLDLTNGERCAVIKLVNKTVRKVASKTMPQDYYLSADLVTWNDNFHRKPGEVEDAYRRAGKSIREELGDAAG